MYLDLAEVKKHLLIDDSFTDDDAYINTLIQVAENSVEVNLNVALKDLEGGDGSIPTPLKQAMLLMIGNLYANREPVAIGVSVAELPLSYRYLVGLYKQWSVR